MPPSYSYLLIEAATVVFFVTVGWEYARPIELWKRHWRAGLILTGIWLGIDLIAVELGLWSFPQGASLPMRWLGLPLEEHLLFLVHTLILALLLRFYGALRP